MTAMKKIVESKRHSKEREGTCPEIWPATTSRCILKVATYWRELLQLLGL
jgi:hypothetical protein